jgi:uncharacterized protein YkwD
MGEDPSRKACNLLAVNFRALLVFAALVLVLPATAVAAPSSKETSILREMNRVRAQHGLRALRLDGRLQRAATAHSREMVATNTFTHGAFGNRMQQFAVTGRIAGENLAWGTGSRGAAGRIVAAWLASPEHRANLLRRSFVRVGVSDLLTGSFLGHPGAHVVTADFAG